MIDKILAIAYHEWPDCKWLENGNRGVRWAGGENIGRSSYFDPLNDWNVLMPLLIKYPEAMPIKGFGLDGETIWLIKLEKQRLQIWGDESDLSEQEYSRVAIEALYELLCAEVPNET